MDAKYFVPLNSVFSLTKTILHIIAFKVIGEQKIELILAY